jgi:hypothetical protein
MRHEVLRIKVRGADGGGGGGDLMMMMMMMMMVMMMMMMMMIFLLPLHQGLLSELLGAMVCVAEEHLDLLMAGFTHLQPAQPVMTMMM